MKPFLKVLSWTIGILVVLIIGILAYVKFLMPNVGDAPEMTIERTPERVARGEYLATHVAVCIDCHSTRDWTKFSGPPKEGTFGKGGEIFNEKYGFPGSYYAKNITPYGISRYTDGELFRVITTGVTKEGRALFPVMPYENYGKMDSEDIKSIIAYIRTLQPIKSDIPKSHSDFPMNFIINTIPHKAAISKTPDKNNKVAYGKYLTTMGGCMDCHTQVDSKGALVPGTEFGGGRKFPLPGGGVVTSHNISSDKETGIGNWTASSFIDLFHSRSDSSLLNSRLKKGETNTLMPWMMYGRMTDEDLEDIFEYLKTTQPVSNKVDNL